MDQRLKGKSKSIKLLEENKGQNLHNIAFDNDFLDMTPKTQATEENISKLYFVKI